MKLILSLLCLFVASFCCAEEESETFDLPINSTEQFDLDLSYLFRAHPWHGIPLGDKAPEIVNCYIEMVPTDAMKYEVDMDTGILMIDRPHKYSSRCPIPYGFLPRTYAGKRVAEFTGQKLKNLKLKGDGDALDVCVLSENPIAHGDLILKAIPIGGFCLLDGNEADDKIIAVLQGDFIYGDLKDISECPEKVIERLRHYFLTYKDAPERGAQAKIQIDHIYGRQEALEVIRRGYQDYLDLINEEL